MPDSTVTITTWNINSIRPRLHAVTDWLKAFSPDVVLLQETKVEDAKFPAAEIEDCGYNVAIHGQKTYNGVAILSKGRIEDVTRALPGDASGEQARFIQALITLGSQIVRVASVYVPNGQEAGSDKFAYKLRFLDRLKDWMAERIREDEVTIIGGDYNVAPFPIDVYAPLQLDGTVCYHPEERARLREILHQGWSDGWRVLHPTLQEFSWWDYRGSSLSMNKGMRIDYLLLSPQAADHLESSHIERDIREADKASDHAPVWVRLRV